MSWETLNNFATFAGVIVLAITFVLGALAYYSQKKVSEIQKKENIKLRTDLEKATAESRRRQIELTQEQQKMALEQ